MFCALLGKRAIGEKARDRMLHTEEEFLAERTTKQGRRRVKELDDFDIDFPAPDIIGGTPVGTPVTFFAEWIGGCGGTMITDDIILSAAQ